MDRIKDVCLEHAKRYVKMQPQDAVKLVFQSEFGGGHLISDEQASINYLIEEARGVDPRSISCSSRKSETMLHAQT